MQIICHSDANSKECLNFQSCSKNIYFPVGFANTCLDHSAVLGPIPKLFCQVSVSKGLRTKTGQAAPLVTGQGAWPQAGLPRASVGVLDFVKERFHSTSPGDCEDVFTEAGDSETKQGLAQGKQ